MGGGGPLMAQPEKPGFFGRVAAAAKLVVRGTVDQSIWFGPLEPLSPVAPVQVEGRRFDYRNGINLVTQARGADTDGRPRLDFQQLRALADNYDLMRLVIETRKDQLAKLDWTIQAKDEKKRDQKDPRIKEVTDFFGMPDKENDFGTWQRMLAEDMMVIDAATLYPRRTRGGALYSLDVIDGATIKPVIDDHGRRPVPPEPAYQQILKGLPAVDYAADMLYYFPRNRRSNLLYGFPPVEQVAMSVNIALRRQLHQLEFYTAGTVPDMVMPVPDSWNMEQLEAFQSYWDGLLTDNTAERRRVRFVPAAMAKGALHTKEAALKDEYDEWLARIVCFAFSISPQWAVKVMNRATAESAHEAALQEGLEPMMDWGKLVADRSIAWGFGYTDLEFVWAEEESVNPTEQAATFNGQLDRGVINRNEYRAEIGRKPMGPDGEVFTVTTAGGVVTLDAVIDPPDPPPVPVFDGEAPGGAVSGAGRGGIPAKGKEGVFERPASNLNGVGNGAKPAKSGRGAKTGEKGGTKRMKKAAGGAAITPVDHGRPAVQKAEKRLALVWSSLFAAERARLAAAARAGARPGAFLRDAGEAPLGGAGGTLKKSAGDEDIDPLDPDAWAEAEARSRKILGDLAQDASEAGLASIGIEDDGITNLANGRAEDWAGDHAAELVSGVGDTTRTALNALVVQAEEEGWSVDQLAGAIEDTSSFDADRALKIAHTEIRTADNQGNLLAWQTAKSELGLDVKKQWVCRGDNVCAECEANEDDGAIGVDEDFTSGDDAPPAHPGCECDVEPVLDEPDNGDTAAPGAATLA